MLVTFCPALSTLHHDSTNLAAGTGAKLGCHAGEESWLHIWLEEGKLPVSDFYSCLGLL